MTSINNLPYKTLSSSLSSRFFTDSSPSNCEINKEVTKGDEYIEVDFVLNFYCIKTVVLDLKKNNIFDDYTLREYITIFINLMKSLKSQKKREVKSFSDTNIGEKSKKVGKFLHFKEELIHFVTNNNTLNENKKKLSSWSILKKKLLKNELKVNCNKLMLNKIGIFKENFQSYSVLSVAPLNVFKKEKFKKIWPSDYHHLFIYVKGEMNILFDINKDYNELLKMMKVLKSKKELYKKNANAYKLLIPVSIKNEYFTTPYKKIQLSLIYEKLGFSQKIIENIGNFIKYDESTEYTKYHLSKLELIFHQYEIRLIRLFIKLNIMHKELIQSKIQTHTN